jgi:hypothetical protein
VWNVNKRKRELVQCSQPSGLQVWNLHEPLRAREDPSSCGRCLSKGAYERYNFSLVNVVLITLNGR